MELINLNQKDSIMNRWSIYHDILEELYDIYLNDVEHLKSINSDGHTLFLRYTVSDLEKKKKFINDINKRISKISINDVLIILNCNENEITHILRKIYIKLNNSIKYHEKYNNYIEKLNKYILLVFNKNGLFSETVTLKNIKLFKKYLDICKYSDINIILKNHNIHDNIDTIKNKRNNQKQIYKISYKKLGTNSFLLDLLLDGGIPIKSFIQTSETNPNVSELLENQCKCKSLDFKNIII